MAEILPTNICCFDLTQDSLDYFKSLGLNVFEGTLGSVFSFDWSTIKQQSVFVMDDIDIPANLHEYHVFVVDTNNTHSRPYILSEHSIGDVYNLSRGYLTCERPINLLDLRPLGSHLLSSRFNKGHNRIEIIFLGSEDVVNYSSKHLGDTYSKSSGNYSNYEAWDILMGSNRIGNRVKLVDNSISKILFEGRIQKITYFQTFSLTNDWLGESSVPDSSFISLLNNGNGECISYIYEPSKELVRFVFPQIDDKAAFLKALFENVLFADFSEYFPDIESRRWINNSYYLLPEENKIKEEINAIRKECEKKVIELEDQLKEIDNRHSFLKQLLFESGSNLVSAVKSYLEWLGFENVVDKDDTLKEGEIREEDLCFRYEGYYYFVEVKGINGTSTDSECSQVDKIVIRRMRELKSTDVHGVYIVNHQRNIEPLKRHKPPFNDTQIKDAENQSRTLVYTMQLFALYSDIENGYINKEQARSDLLRIGLAQFHNHLLSLGVPYNYYQEDKVICLDLQNTQVKIGDTLYYKDPLDRLVGLKIESLQQEKKEFHIVKNGKTGIRVDRKVPRNKEVLMFKPEE